MSEPEIITKNPVMLRALLVADRVSRSDATVLIVGETGTGKELVARRIHCRSDRSNKEFVDVNCGAIPELLIESQLFGHERGAFTGATTPQVGLFEVADGGTIFLDEIGELSPSAQVKVLRVLQDGTFRRVGSPTLRTVDVRVIAATHHDLAKDLLSGRFRPDLFYRLDVVSIELPPLRERLEDVSGLVLYFCHKLGTEKSFTPDALERLRSYCWKGNVRELENFVERVAVLCDDAAITSDDVVRHLSREARKLSTFNLTKFENDVSLREVKNLHVQAVLQKCDGNKSMAARILGINVKTLYSILKVIGGKNF